MVDCVQLLFQANAVNVYVDVVHRHHLLLFRIVYFQLVDGTLPLYVKVQRFVKIAAEVDFPAEIPLRNLRVERTGQVGGEV